MLICSLVVETVYAEKNEYCAAVRERIERKIAAVVKYAQLAKQWGFDGVEIHGHHWGYLLDQFAMAYTNHRTDEYGGDLDGRLTFARKIITGIKEACGKDYPVSMRLCMKTYMKGYNQPSLNGDGEVGRDIDEAIEIAKRYEQYGVDMINCNTGSYDAFFYCVSPYYLEKGYNVEYARKLKAALNIPVIVAGAMDDPDICKEAVESGAVDGITIGRAGLVDSSYPNKVAAGKLDDIRPCIKCTNCIETVLSSGCPLCSANPAAMLEQRYGVKKTLEKKKIAVIGGGLTGCELAYDLARFEGRNVTLVEGLDDILSAGPKVPNSVNMMLRLLLKEYKVNIITGHMIAEVNDEGAVIKAKDGMLETVPADNVVFAIGLRPQPSMAAELLDSGITVYEVGDGSRVGNIQTCTSAAYEVARAL